MVGFDICKGNPGATAFLAQAYRPEKSMQQLAQVERAFQRMQDNNIVGEDLYRLWNDCLDRNTDKAIGIMLMESIDTIKEHLPQNARGIPFSEDPEEE